jgi:hypothetical protein
MVVERPTKDPRERFQSALEAGVAPRHLVQTASGGATPNETTERLGGEDPLLKAAAQGGPKPTTAAPVADARNRAGAFALPFVLGMLVAGIVAVLVSAIVSR